ncbi:hypothetical protein [Magnetospirillum molischianum]|uniref:hypothetical protein n=1 Tax=Magnetospirillum molischianum TaxID=1083 RepID=UPI001F212E55|nr:hypothetical protein [Magnetospirillum molischianum]
MLSDQGPGQLFAGGGVVGCLAQHAVHQVRRRLGLTEGQHQARPRQAGGDQGGVVSLGLGKAVQCRFGLVPILFDLAA